MTKSYKKYIVLFVVFISMISIVIIDNVLESSGESDLKVNRLNRIKKALIREKLDVIEQSIEDFNDLLFKLALKSQLNGYIEIISKNSAELEPTICEPLPTLRDTEVYILNSIRSPMSDFYVDKLKKLLSSYQMLIFSYKC